MTSCYLQLTTAEPGCVHQDTDYFCFSSVFDSNEDKNLYRENILSNEYVCCLSTINHIVDSQPVTIGSCISMLHQVLVNSTMVRHMNLYYLYLKSVLTYESHT